jgi:hypothetical protein
MTELTDFEIDLEISHLGVSLGADWDDDFDAGYPTDPQDVSVMLRRVYRAGMAKGVAQLLRAQDAGYPQRYLTGGPA